MSDFPNSLFDTRSEFARDLPLELVAAWNASAKTAAAAQKLLAPFRVRGTVIVSDSVGLTRLSANRDPLEVMALINRPKELVHEFGTAIGGTAVGLWTADNTEMFYPEGVAMDRIASMLLALQDRIQSECEVQIGMAAHFDTFFLIGNSIYGKPANAVESLAEDRTAGGEIVFTEAAWNRLAASGEIRFSAIPRNEAAATPNDGYRLVDGPRHNLNRRGNSRYPFPFSEDFYACLTAYYEQRDLDSFRRDVLAQFSRRYTVLLTERETVLEEGEAGVLGEIAAAAVAHARGSYLLAATTGIEVKTAGSLSIYVFEQPDEAIKFAIRLREALALEGIRTRSGIASGEVLVFDLPGGGRDISGSPVNLASKVAQDYGEFGRIYVINESGTMSFAVGDMEIRAAVH